MANKIADAGWDDMPVIQYLMKHGGDIETDSYGQLVVYTGLYENAKGELVEPEESEIDANGVFIDEDDDENESDNDDGTGTPA